MKGLPALLASLLLSGGLVLAARVFPAATQTAAVKVWEEQIHIPTYLVGEPEPNPIFYFGRASQGAEGRVYPYPLYDVLTVEPQSLLDAFLREVECSEPDLDRHPKGHPHKATLAHQIRRETPMTRDWIAQRQCQLRIVPAAEAVISVC